MTEALSNQAYITDLRECSSPGLLQIALHCTALYLREAPVCSASNSGAVCMLSIVVHWSSTE